MDCEDDAGEEALLVLSWREGLLLAGAILRFLLSIGDWLNGRRAPLQQEAAIDEHRRAGR